MVELPRSLSSRDCSSILCHWHKMVRDTRLELATSRPPGVRATNCATPRCIDYSISFRENKGWYLDFLSCLCYNCIDDYFWGKGSNNCILIRRIWKLKKVVLVILMLCMAVCSVSFSHTEAVEVAKPESTEIADDSVNFEPMKEVATSVKEVVKIPEIELPEWTDEEIEIVETMMLNENPIEEVKGLQVQELAVQNDDIPSLEWIKEHLYLYYTDDEIRLTTLIVQAEDLVAQSDTIWSAHVWVILGRVGAFGFGANSIIEVLSAPGQFSTWCTQCLSKEPVTEVEAIVRDVFARKVLEDMGAPEWEVGRTVPATHLFFDNRNGDLYNEFYRYCWGDCYDPFQAPYNPYSN